MAISDIFNDTLFSIGLEVKVNFLYLAIIHPLELLIEFFFIFFDKSFDDYGIAIVGISLVINLLALPLYHIAETLQQKERDTKMFLAPGVARIKSVFKGDEQYMILSTYYRQNHYHPAFALRSSVSLLIQVPFFIAAYRFISNLAQLQGKSFLFIPNLGAPDGLLAFDSYTLNILPLLMTAINIIAGAIYTRGFPLRDKLQLYGMAALFLVLLYNSPAGLVLYWTLNNIFSLVKNIFYKIKHPLSILYMIAVGGSVGLTIAIWILHPTLSAANRLVLISGCVFIICIPIILHAFKYLYHHFLVKLTEATKWRNMLFILSGVLLFFLQGVVVPANLIASSTIEFINTGNVSNPIFYVMHNAEVFFGVWILWPVFIFSMANKPMKTLLALFLSILSLTALVNVFLFTGKYGIVSTLLQFENPTVLEASLSMLLLPLFSTVIIVAILLMLVRYGKTQFIVTCMTLLVLGTGISGLYASSTIQREYREYQENAAASGGNIEDSNQIEPVFNFSKEGKNVLYFILDRGINSFLPYLLQDIPELQEQMEGFVYYPNTISFGNNTIHGSPAMMGGYEYSPDAINLRNDQKLVEKHNEALLVLPKLFQDAGYSITITDPPYSNYKWEADYSAYRPYPEMNVMHQHGKFAISYKNEHKDELDWDPAYESDLIKKRMPLFSIFKTSFPLLRRTLYEEGRYFQKAEKPQSTDAFVESFSQLYYLRQLSSFTSEENAFICITNDTPHQPLYLQSPEYKVMSQVSDYSTPIDGLEGVRPMDIQHYQINAASLRQLGLWFEQLKMEGVYDNTRIIIVADHGYELYSDGMKVFTSNKYYYNSYVPLLMVKDFNARGPIRIDSGFMTNADAPLFAIKDILDDPTNPFTGNNLFDQVQKDSAHVYFGPWDPRQNSGSVFVTDPTHSFTVHDSIFKEENWSPITE